MKPGPQTDRIGTCPHEPALLHFVRPCQQIDTFGREGELECCAIALRVVRFGDQAAGDEAALSSGQLKCQPIAEGLSLDLRIPAGAAGEKAATDISHGRQTLECAAMICIRQLCESPVVAQKYLLGSRAFR